MLRLILVLGALAVPALAPALVAVGRRPLALLLALPAGGVLAAVAAEAAVATSTSMSPWLVAVDVVANVAAAGVVMTRRRAARPGLVPGIDPVRIVAPAVVVAALALTALRRHALDWDARSIWLLHARLLRAGGDHYVAALHNSAYTFSHVDYPPLASATVVAAWKVWGSSSYRVAQLVLALQGACLLVAAACLVGGHVRALRPRWLPSVLTAAFVLAALGPIGLYLTNGYADVIVAAGAAVAALALLVEPPAPTATAVGVLGLLVAALTKDEGLVAALLVLALWVVRSIRAGRRVRPVAVVVAATAAVMLAWPAVVAAHGGPHGSILGSGTVAPSTTGDLVRLTRTITTLAGHLLVTPIVAVATVLLVLAVRRRDRPDLLGPIGRLWVLVVVDVVVLVATYTLGKLPIHYWLRTSGDRVSIFPVLMLDAIAVLTVAAAVERRAVDAPGTEAAGTPVGPVEMHR